VPLQWNGCKPLVPLAIGSRAWALGRLWAGGGGMFAGLPRTP
jgi:hypothetical protein